MQAKLFIARPWLWKRGKSTEALRTALGEHVALFSSGREALFAILKAIDVQAGEEIIIQGYTCAVVANAIHAAGGVPVYADIDRDSLNLTAESVEKLLSNRTRAIICQHTFGIPADVAALKALCEERNIILIEDCAHVMPDDVGPSEIGKHGDVVFFSFGRDKAISGITGGAVIQKNAKCKMQNAKLEEDATHLSAFTIFRLLCYPCLYVAARPVYGIGLGKALLKIAQWLGLLLPVVSEEEKKGHMPPLLHKMPNACAALAFTQLQQLKLINEHRRTLTHLYLEHVKKNHLQYPKTIRPDLPLQKFPLFVSHADAVRADLKKKNIHLEDGWTGAVVCPRSTNQQSVNYTEGSCPVAEQIAFEILNLPTHGRMTEKKAKRLIAGL